MSEISILIVSCDRYSDLWQPFFTLFWRNWPDCPFPVYLGSNHQSFDHPQVISLLLGDNDIWSERLKLMLNQIHTPYLLTLVEDFFLFNYTDTADVLSCFDVFRELDADMLRLKPDPPPDYQVEGFPLIGRIGINAFFRISMQAALWRRDFLLKLLQEKESTWEFEVRATERSRKMENNLYCTWQPILHYSHVIEKGKWFRWAAKHFGNMRIGCDFNRRPVMTIGDSCQWNYRCIIGRLRMRVSGVLSWEQRQQLRQLKAKFFLV